MPVVLVGYGYTEDVPVGEIDCDAVFDSVADVIDAFDSSVVPAKAGT
jgi:hypothetical protein